MSNKSDADTAKYTPFDARAFERPLSVSSLVRVDAGALTDRGKVRPNNEDHFLVVRYGRSVVTWMTNLAEGQVPDRFEETGYGLAVADGMGGAAAGELASSMALTVAVNLALHHPSWILRITEQQALEVMERWRQRMCTIDFVVSERARADPALTGMGTTLTVACSIGADLFLCHVGDSRAYLFRKGKLHKKTRDQTLAQALADMGQIAQEEVPTHRLRHVLTQVIGGQRGHVQAEIQHLQLADGDRLLLCTDGLTEMVDEAAITDVLRRVESSAEACRVLVDLALERGGKDNVTLVLARYTIPEGSPAGGPATADPR
jgi:protein phosphatase